MSLKSNKDVPITLGKVYHASETPMMYDSITFQPTGRAYVITGNDGLDRKYDMKWFTKLSEFRNNRIDEILE